MKDRSLSKDRNYLRRFHKITNQKPEDLWRNKSEPLRKSHSFSQKSISNWALLICEFLICSSCWYAPAPWTGTALKMALIININTLQINDCSRALVSLFQAGKNVTELNKDSRNFVSKFSVPLPLKPKKYSLFKAIIWYSFRFGVWAKLLVGFPVLRLLEDVFLWLRWHTAHCSRCRHDAQRIWTW